MRNTIIFLHNILILVIVLIVFPPEVTAATWLVLPGLLLDMVILLGLAVMLSLINLRYRDTHLAVASAMQVLPFVTPIFWDKPMLQHRKWIADNQSFLSHDRNRAGADSGTRAGCFIMGSGWRYGRAFSDAWDHSFYALPASHHLLALRIHVARHP